MWISGSDTILVPFGRCPQGVIGPGVSVVEECHERIPVPLRQPSHLMLLEHLPGGGDQRGNGEVLTVWPSCAAASSIVSFSSAGRRKFSRASYSLPVAMTISSWYLYSILPHTEFYLPMWQIATFMVPKSARAVIECLVQGGGLFR